MKKFIANSGTLKRFKYIYLPFILIVCAVLFIAAELTEKNGEHFSDAVPRFNDNIPIVYHPHYNIEFFGLEELHHFDSKKYGRIYEILNDQGIDTNSFIAGQRANNKL